LALLSGLYLTTGGVRKLTETTWTAKLVAGCEMDFVTSVGVVALTCPGVDYTRLRPLPVVQPWEGSPGPVGGWMAEKLNPVERSGRPQSGIRVRLVPDGND
jgi:hypothetical protein